MEYLDFSSLSLDQRLPRYFVRLPKEFSGGSGTSSIGISGGTIGAGVYVSWFRGFMISRIISPTIIKIKSSIIFLFVVCFCVREAYFLQY